MSSGVTRHIHSKSYYGKDLLIRKIIELRHCPTLLMIADIFTKDLDYQTFNNYVSDYVMIMIKIQSYRMQFIKSFMKIVAMKFIWINMNRKQKKY